MATPEIGSEAYYAFGEHEEYDRSDYPTTAALLAEWEARDKTASPKRRDAFAGNFPALDLTARIYND